MSWKIVHFQELSLPSSFCIIRIGSSTWSTWDWIVSAFVIHCESYIYYIICLYLYSHVVMRSKKVSSIIKPKSSGVLKLVLVPWFLDGPSAFLCFLGLEGRREMNSSELHLMQVEPQNANVYLFQQLYCIHMSGSTWDLTVSAFVMNCKSYLY